jgi:hypothetical protein
MAVGYYWSGYPNDINQRIKVAIIFVTPFFTIIQKSDFC